jgi:REP element-mobilizing transposase RayT
MRTPQGWPCRRSIRLRGFDYRRPGFYFVTIGTQNRLPLFGRVRQGEVRLNEAGRMVSQIWWQLPHRYAGITLDAFVLMPDHVHGIIVLGADGVRPSMGVPDVVHRFKSFTTTQYRRGVNFEGWQPFPGRLWHRNYYERIIRDRAALHAIRRYIADNPRRS